MSALKTIIEKFKPVEITYDISTLPADIQNALPHLKKAMDAVTEIFLKQQAPNLPEQYNKVMEGDDEHMKEFFDLFLGPWDQLNDYKSAFESYPDRPKGCAFYPKEITEELFYKTINNMNDREKEIARDHYSIIESENDSFKAIPYHVYYAEELAEVFDHLEKAADEIENETLKHFILNRAESLVSGSYRESDAQWVELKDVPLDIVIGPFEVYADALLGLKATYEAFLLVIDHEKGSHLKEIENNLPNLAEIFPVPVGSKAAVGNMAPMEVVHQIYAGGEARQGIMASAFNLPNDPWVRGNVGWKQVMIYNVMKAKFESCTVNIADRISNGKITADFEPYFYFVLLHEVSHGLGPAYRANGESVAKSIGTHYTAIEEAKADIGSLFLLIHRGGECGIPRFDKSQLLDSFFAGLFRSMRFGVHEAHGAANVIEFNFFKEHGVIKKDDNGNLYTDHEKLVETTDLLLNTLCEIEANATQEEAGEFIKKYAKPGNDIINALEKLSDIPIDIKVTYPI